jgi:hypothetical protein
MRFEDSNTHNNRQPIDLNMIVDSVLLEVDEPLKQIRLVMKEVSDYFQRAKMSGGQYGCVLKGWLYDIRFCIDAGSRQKVY